MLEALGGLLIGVCLGLLGSGGSILTVPLLVYLLGHDPKVAIAESLAIVGGIALIGAIGPALRKRVDWPSVLFFGIPALVGTVGGVWASQFMAGSLQLAIFAVVMLLAAGLMFRGKSGSVGDEDRPPRTTRDLVLVMLEGTGVGILTGIVGVGGGFLIVPALVLLGRLSMGVAVGTSLVIIAIKSLFGFLKNWDQFAGSEFEISWVTIALFVGFGGVGSLLGSGLGRRIPQERLRQVFGGFLVVMGIAILVVTGPKMIQDADSAAAEGVGSAVVE